MYFQHQIVESCSWKFVRLESALRSVSAVGSATRQLGFNTVYSKVKVHLNNILCFYLLESKILSLGLSKRPVSACG